MNLRSLRSYGLLVAMISAAAAPFVACSSPSDEEPMSEADIVNNTLGLGIRFDAESHVISASLKNTLPESDQLRIRVRAGLPKIGEQDKLPCDQIPVTTKTMPTTVGGKVVYKTSEPVSKDVLALVDIYDDHRWQTDAEFARQQLARINELGGPKVIVEACVTDSKGRPKARLQTTLENAWDEAELDDGEVSTQSLNILARDGGSDASRDASRPRAERPLRSMESFAAKCVAELGEIPFFKKLGPGKYDTFDCRDFKGTGEGHDPADLADVEGSLIPLMQDDREVTKCDGAGPNGTKSYSSYDCVSKCDKAEFLSEGCEVGPTVTHARNDKGTHWTLLCRKVSSGDQVGWTKTKKFDDIAMIGHNPKTGKTCFFQNMIGSGTDGEHVPHPADKQKSRTLWDSPKGYCFENCHSGDPFIQSPWINGARRKSNGRPVVPMMGYDPDFEISWLESPYYVINMDAQGWTIPKQLAGAVDETGEDDVGPCLTCHRVAGSSWMSQFANWTTGNRSGGGPINGDSYWNKITDSYKKFEKTHWMPMRLDGITEQNWDQSKWAKAVARINKCNANPSDASCIWADVPRGASNPPAPSR